MTSLFDFIKGLSEDQKAAFRALVDAESLTLGPARIRTPHEITVSALAQIEYRMAYNEALINGN